MIDPETESIVAIVVFDECQVPPNTVDVSVSMLPTHISAEDIVPAVALDVVVTFKVETTTPQIVFTIYEIVVDPGETPVTFPLASIVAKAGDDDIQLPPDTVEESDIVNPTQTLDDPDIVPAEGVELIVTIAVLTHPAGDV